MDAVITDADLSYPALRFWPEFVEVCNNADELGHTNRLGLKNKCLIGAEVIDAQMRLLRTVDAVKEHGVGRFGGHNLFFNQWIKARLSFSVVKSHVEMDEVRNRVIATVRKNRSFHESGGDVGEMLGAIAKAESFEDLAGEVF